MAKVLILNPVLTAAENTDSFATGVSDCDTFFPDKLVQLIYPHCNAKDISQSLPVDS